MLGVPPKSAYLRSLSLTVAFSICWFLQGHRCFIQNVGTYGIVFKPLSIRLELLPLVILKLYSSMRENISNLEGAGPS